MTFDHSFYEDEVRCDFYIPSIIKRTWAAQLQILADLDKVCRENDIEYFAEWGSLLGAVRHSGFIPWDDDMDICMKRKDYIKFLDIAEKVLPNNYYIVNYRTSPNFKQSLCRIVSADHYRFDPEYLSKYSGLPFAMGIDIFPMDYLTDDEEYENRRREKVYHLQSVLDMIESDGRSIQEILPQLEAVERHYHIRIPRNEQAKTALHDIIEQTYGEVAYKDAKYITLYPIWFGNRNYQFPKEYYEHKIDMPFENTTIPVPVFYNDILRRKYGESYMTPVRSGGAHDYPYYEIHMQVLRSAFDFEWPAYKYSSQDVHRVGFDKRPAFYELVSECLKSLQAYHDELLSDVSRGNCEDEQEILQRCQDLAIRVGTLIEMRYYEGSIAVSILERYCETVYETGLCTDVDEAFKMISKLQNFPAEFEKAYHSEFDNKRVVLYITYSAEQFRTMEPEIRARMANGGNTIIKIMPIPVHRYDASFKLIEDEYDIDAYPSDLEYIDYRNFDLIVHPEEIVTGYPYDGYGLITDIDKEYYAKNLWESTDKLSYIPFFTLKMIEESDQRLYKNLKICVNTPISIIADEIRLTNEDTRRSYETILSEFVGEQEKDMISDKLRVNDFGEKITCEDSNPGQEARTLLFYVGINSFVPNPEKMIEKMKNVFDLFKEPSQEVTLLYMEQNGLREAVKKCFDNGDELIGRIDSIIDSSGDAVRCIPDDKRCRDFDYTSCCAYYGEASYLVHEFINSNKSVMIMNVNI